MAHIRRVTSIYDTTGHMCVSRLPIRNSYLTGKTPREVSTAQMRGSARFASEFFSAIADTYEVREMENRVIHRPEAGVMASLHRNRSESQYLSDLEGDTADFIRPIRNTAEWRTPSISDNVATPSANEVITNFSTLNPVTFNVEQRLSGLNYSSIERE